MSLQERNVEVTHLHGTFLDQTLELPCLHHQHASECKLQACDLCVFGTPCNAFSDAGVKRYRSGSIARHPLSQITFRDAKNMVVKGNHRCIVMEQVEGFNKPVCSDASQLEPTPMQTPGPHVISVSVLFQ